jgi:cytochrome c biogenesis factor
MNASAITIGKPFFLLLTGIFILLAILVAFIIMERNSIGAQNRYLILKNDSIMSVNILLSDSLKQRPNETSNKKSVTFK